jgi:hypothetical protein
VLIWFTLLPPLLLLALMLQAGIAQQLPLQSPSLRWGQQRFEQGQLLLVLLLLLLLLLLHC